MDRNGIWRLSPAYDVTFSYNPTNKWLQKHQILINNKSEQIKFDDLIQTALTKGISKTRAKGIIFDVKEAVNLWPVIAAENGIRKSTINLISNTISELVSI